VSPNQASKETAQDMINKIYFHRFGIAKTMEEKFLAKKSIYILKDHLTKSYSLSNLKIPFNEKSFNVQKKILEFNLSFRNMILRLKINNKK
jgi:hypothetical protein